MEYIVYTMIYTYISNYIIYMLDIAHLIYRDKSVTHHTIGTMNCSGMRDSYNTCRSIYTISICKELYNLSMNCYRRSEDEFIRYLDDKVHERLSLNAMLNDNMSILYDIRLANNRLLPYEYSRKEANNTSNSIYEQLTNDIK